MIRTRLSPQQLALNLPAAPQTHPEQAQTFAVCLNSVLMQRFVMTLGRMTEAIEALSAVIDHRLEVLDTIEHVLVRLDYERHQTYRSLH
jgi:hypothetical protein